MILGTFARPVSGTSLLGLKQRATNSAELPEWVSGNANSAPTHAALQPLMGKIITRILRLLTRLGYFVEEDGQIYLGGGLTDPDDVMTPLQAAADGDHK